MKATALRFRDDPDELEFTLFRDDGYGAQAQQWTRNVLWGLPVLLGQDDARLDRLPGAAYAGTYVYAGYRIVGMESGDPNAWRNTVCGVARRSGLEPAPGDLPAAAFEGDVCGGVK